MKRAELLIIPLGIAFFLAIIFLARLQAPEDIVVPEEPKPKVTIPDFGAFKNVKRKKTAFFEFMLPMIRQANGEVISQREELIDIVDEIDRNARLPPARRKFVEELAQRYRVKLGDQVDRATLRELLLRVDTVPASLILAQAANESAWGTSRFATEANNFFGIWCFTVGCGVTPRYRDEGLTHEVRRFDTVEDGVRYYLRTINSNNAYRELRAIRAQLRAEGREITGTRLAEGLLRYSERGEEYVEEIQAMIRINRLREYNLAASSRDDGAG